jgi:hypothetical protein
MKMYSLPAAISLSRRPELLKLSAGSSRQVGSDYSLESVKDISVSWRVPSCLVGISLLRDGEQRLLVDSGVSRLVEGEDVDVVVLVLLDDSSRVVVGVERVHEDEWDVDTVLGVEVLSRQPNTSVQSSNPITHLNLPDTEIQESHALPDLNDTLGTDTTHGCTETTVELEHSELVEDSRVDRREDLVRSDLLRLGSLDFVPVAS